MFKLSRKNGVVLIILASLLIFPLGLAQAIDYYYWNVPSGNWEDPISWNPSGPPGSLDYATINNGGTAAIANANANADAYSLTVGDIAGTGTVDHSASQLTVGWNLILGNSSASQGTYSQGNYNLSGSGSLATYYLILGYWGGYGAFNQSGGTVNVGYGVYLGFNGSGNYGLSGGSLTADRLAVSQGTFKQTGGTVNLDTNLTVEDNYELSSGSLTLGLGSSLIVGYGGYGTFKQSGGTANGYNMTLGYQYGTTGTYELSELSGTSSLTADYLNVGVVGHGTFKQTGGTANFTKELNLGLGNMWTPGYGSGTYELSGGSLTADKTFVGYLDSGTFKQTGGSHTVTTRLSLGERYGSVGTYELKDGQLFTNNVDVGGHFMVWGEPYYDTGGSGTFTHSGGTHTVSGTLTLGQGPLSQGTYNLSGTGNLNVNAMVVGNQGTGTFNQTGGTFTANSLTNRGQVNLTRGTATINGPVANLASGQMNIGSAGFLFQMNATFNAPVENWGAVNVAYTTVTFKNTYTEHGSYTSGPWAYNSFTDLIVEPTGFLVDSQPSTFKIGNDFLNRSEMNLDWQTGNGSLYFYSLGDNIHTMLIPGVDKGGSPEGYVNNFSWHLLSLSGQELWLSDADTVLNGGALYLRQILGLAISDRNVLNIHSTNGLNLYYDPAWNFSLSGIYNLEGGGYLIPVPGLAPVPVPGTVWLLLSGLTGLAGLRKLRAKN